MTSKALILCPACRLTGCPKSHCHPDVYSQGLGQSRTNRKHGDARHKRMAWQASSSRGLNQPGSAGDLTDRNAMASEVAINKLAMLLSA